MTKLITINNQFLKKHSLAIFSYRIALLLLFFLSHCSYSLLSQQRFKAGINLGVTAAQINGDDSANFNKLGLTAGLRAVTLLGPKSDLLIEILYSQRGSRTELLNNTGIPQRIINLHYIEVPVIYNIKDWYQEEEDYHKMHFFGGVSYGRLFSSDFENSPLEQAAPFFRENDFSWLVGASFHLNSHVGFYARYTRSINLLFKNTANNPNANSLLGFFLTFGGTYVF